MRRIPGVAVHFRRASTVEAGASATRSGSIFVPVSGGRQRGPAGDPSLRPEPGVGVRLLQIDWSAPTLDAFVFGAYPFAMPVTLVTAGQPAGVAGDFLAFARSPQGNTLLRRSLLPTP